MGGDIFDFNVFVTAEHAPVPVVRVLQEDVYGGIDIDIAVAFGVGGDEAVGEQVWAGDGVTEVIVLPVWLGSWVLLNVLLYHLEGELGVFGEVFADGFERNMCGVVAEAGLKEGEGVHFGWERDGMSLFR